MDLNPHERQIAEALADHRTRRRDGADAAPDRYAEELGPEAFAELQSLLAVERAIDEALGEDAPPAADAAPVRPILRLSGGVRRVLAIAAGLILCVLAWQWIQQGGDPVGTEDPESSVALARLELQLIGRDAPQRLVPRSTLRSGSDDGADHGLLPAGRLRPKDLHSLQLLLPEMAPLDGRLVFRHEDGSLLHQEPLARNAIPQEADLPAEVSAALAAGGRATWGFETDDGPSWTVPIQVLTGAETREVDEALARIRAGTKTQPASVRAWLEASYLLDQDLVTAALRTAAAAAEAPGRANASPLPWIQMREALLRLGLLDTRFGEGVRDALDEFGEEGHEATQAAIDALFEARSPDR